MGGIYWFPPRLRRQVYGLLELRVEVHADRTLTVSREFDADLMRLTPEVEAWVEGFREIDARLQERAEADPPADMQEGIDRIERELAALTRQTGLRAEDATRRSAPARSATEPSHRRLSAGACAGDLPSRRCR